MNDELDHTAEVGAGIARILEKELGIPLRDEARISLGMIVKDLVRVTRQRAIREVGGHLARMLDVDDAVFKASPAPAVLDPRKVAEAYCNDRVKDGFTPWTHLSGDTRAKILRAMTNALDNVEHAR